MGEQLSMLDTMFLDLEQVDDTAHMHIGAALVFGPLPTGGPPEHDLLLAQMKARIGLLPRFTQKLSAPHSGPLTWLTWEPDPHFDLATHVHRATLPAPGGDAELQEWLAEFWSHRLDRRRPLWEMTVLDGLEDGRWVLATKTHHCLVDGIGSIDIGHLVLDAVPDAPPPEAVEVAATASRGGRFWLTPSHVRRSAQATFDAARHPREAFERARAAVDLVYRDEILAAPHTSLTGPMSGTRAYAAVRFDLADVKAIKQRLGGTVNDVVLALCAGGLRALLDGRGEPLPPAGVRAQVPVNIRSEDKAHAMGNQLTSLFVELPVAEADPLARYRAVVDRAAELKAGTQRVGGKTIVDIVDLAPPLAGALLGRSMFGQTRMFNLTITNVPGPQQRLYAFGAPLVEALPFVPLFAEHRVGIAVASYAGQMVFGLTGDRVSVPDLRVLAEGIERAFADLQPPAARRRGRRVHAAPAPA